MKRRHFLKTAGAAGLAGAAASTIAAPAIAQGKRELKMVPTWPKALPALGLGAQRLANRITQFSDGQLSVKVFGGGELVPPFGVFDAVSSGAADMYHSAAYYYQGKHKALNFFTAVPFGFTAAEATAWVHFGGGQELWDEVGAQFNIKSFMAGNTGVQMGGWFAKEINSLDDLKGLKFRMPGIGGEVLRRLGVAVELLPPQEILPALQSGRIDGTEWVGPYSDLSFGFYKVVKYYYYPGFHEPGAILDFSINKGVWDSLTDAQRDMITAAVTAENDLVYAEFNARNSDALNTLINDHGVLLRQFSDTILNEVGRLSGEVMAEMADTDPLTRKVYDSFTAFRRKACAGPAWAISPS